MSKRERLIITLLLFVGALISSYYAIQTLIKYEIQLKVNNLLDKFPGNASYKNLSYSLIKNEITIKDLKLSYQNYTAEVEKIKIDLPYTISKIPSYLSLSFIDATISSNLPYLKEMLSLANYYKSKVEINAASIYSASGNSIHVSLSAEGKELGTVNLGAQLKGKISSPSQLKLTKLEIIYRDRGMVRGFFKKQAEMAGEKVDEFKKQLISSIKEELPPYIFSPLSKFIKNPRCLHVSLNPDHPVTTHEIANILKKSAPLKEISSKLNITLSTCD